MLGVLNLFTFGSPSAQGFYPRARRIGYKLETQNASKSPACFKEKGHEYCNSTLTMLFSSIAWKCYGVVVGGFNMFLIID